MALVIHVHRYLQIQIYPPEELRWDFRRPRRLYPLQPPATFVTDQFQVESLELRINFRQGVSNTFGNAGSVESSKPSALHFSAISASGTRPGMP